MTQNDLQREYHLARQNMATLHLMPHLLRARPLGEMDAGIPAIAESLSGIRQLLEMYRRQLTDAKTRRKLARLTNRLFKTSAELMRLAPAQK